MSIAYKISGFNRRRKWKLFWEIIKPRPEEKILDVGFSEIEYSPTDNFLEKNYPYLEQVTALSVDLPKEFSRRYPRAKAVVYDGREFPFPDNSFDVSWSNAVLEHVGGRESQTRFLKEIYRVSRRAFITTPNRFFPFEIHTRVPLLHLFLSKKLFDKFLCFVGKQWAAGDYLNLLSESQLRRLLSAAGVKNYKIIKNKLLGFTLDFVVVWNK